MSLFWDILLIVFIVIGSGLFLYMIGVMIWSLTTKSQEEGMVEHQDRSLRWWAYFHVIFLVAYIIRGLTL